MGALDGPQWLENLGFITNTGADKSRYFAAERLHQDAVFFAVIIFVCLPHLYCLSTKSRSSCALVLFVVREMRALVNPSSGGDNSVLYAPAAQKRLKITAQPREQSSCGPRPHNNI